MLNKNRAPEKRAQSLAQTLAVSLNDISALDKYLACCRKYPERLIYKAIGTAKATPAEKIKKSRAALFFYLVKKYAHHTHYNPRS